MGADEVDDELALGSALVPVNSFAIANPDVLVNLYADAVVREVIRSDQRRLLDLGELERPRIQDRRR